MLLYAGGLFKFLFNLYLKDEKVGESLTVLGSSFHSRIVEGKKDL